VAGQELLVEWETEVQWQVAEKELLVEWDEIEVHWQGPYISS